ncbi:beta-1,3-galactosyl-O-glycosyl-glycoprotein beta-1,6-N-acetylglucosaminyltransferase 4 isoform X2 [Pan paniscus]|nr:beta-1,3-galactosyl-O-glycosyl-glycoprotein beta-1,6-N-acetylglucosaminyltransferase 4 isoform X2 [Pan paniscus]XP_008961067.3 beta-1,3-galactosyl-O-glycosyl-glycoprotein beta-1,6-N-acetylglucosaminyltransferase 4 isoform X2 [Pan paniscus]XP_008961069.3 beta-1,3-galactosyl-O-glycosyl-glycoprotein beta-1,6-N-acetylglucosaminyltransferase 4 isoform X2 [Pan paniscus]XP_008961070.3 beta-1,3-galactosyl-O-glycosyl-glycoprotein beta-1,6-N-acetylglucosaminyltransferase 4 isoform X2 [Pan paniscus]XP_
MKIFKCYFKHTLQQKVFILFLTLWLLSLLKLLNVRRLFPQKDIYLVEYSLSTSPFVRNRYTHVKDEVRYEVNCSGIYEQEPLEIGKSLEIRRRDIIDLEDDDVVAMTSDCDIYQTLRGYAQKLVSKEEKSFPIAYSLVVHKDAVMVERLIHAIYNQHNIYCIHYDRKAPDTFKVAMNNLAKCFSNIFIASKLEAVEYAHISRLQADLNCLSDLLKSSIQWKYVINLCGQDFPLKSNFELVSELKKLNGANMLETVKPPNSKLERFTYHHELRRVPYEYVKLPIRTNISKEAPPHNIQIFVGSAYFVLSQAFVKYIFNNSIVQDFFAWSKDTYSPDEHFWATLIRVPGIPGEISRSAQDVSDLQSKTRLVKWNYYEGFFYPGCTGSHLRSVCIYGAAELRWLIKDGHWFANKFDSKVDPILIKCLAEKLEEQQRDWITLSSEKLFMDRNLTTTS